MVDVFVFAGARVSAPLDLLTIGVATHYVSQSDWSTLLQALREQPITSSDSVSSLLNRFHQMPMMLLPPHLSSPPSPPSLASSSLTSSPSSSSSGSTPAKAPPVPIFSREVLACLTTCFGSHIQSIEQALQALDDVAEGELQVTLPTIAGRISSAPLGGANSASASSPSSSPSESKASEESSAAESRMLRYSSIPLSGAEEAAVKAFAAKTAKELRGKSPLALKVCFI